MPHRANIVDPRNILRKEHADNSRHLARFGRIAQENPGPRMRRANRRDLEHATLGPFIVHIVRHSRDVQVTALVRKASVRSVLRNPQVPMFPRLTKSCLGFVVELLQQLRNQFAPVFGGSSHICDRCKCLQEQRANRGHRFRGPGLSSQSFFGAADPAWHERYPAIDQPCVLDGAVRVKIHAETT